MIKPPHTVSIAFVHGMLAGIGYPLVPCRQWLVDAGIAPELLDRPTARVTTEQYVALFQLLMDRRDDEFLGFLSRPLRRGTFALLARSTLGAPTLAQALRHLSRTFRLLQDDIRLVNVREGGLVGFCAKFNNPACARQPFLHELQLRVFWRLIVWLHGGRLKPTRFDFAFAEPLHAGEYHRVFPGLVRFAQPHTAVWFEAGELARPMLRDEKAMREFLAQAPGIVIVPQRIEHAISVRVRAHLQAMRPTWPDLPATADALHLSVSTLQRHLAGEGANFQAVKDQLRRDLAIVRLSTGNVSLAQLAGELGFADSPAFQRAFKAWTGSAPGAYRRSFGAPRALGG